MNDKNNRPFNINTGGHEEPFTIQGPLSKNARLKKAETSLTELIDFVLTEYAMLLEHGFFDHDQFARMNSILKEARRKLGADFTMAEGMKAIRMAYRLEIRSDKKKPT